MSEFSAELAKTHGRSGRVSPTQAQDVMHFFFSCGLPLNVQNQEYQPHGGGLNRQFWSLYNCFVFFFLAI